MNAIVVNKENLLATITRNRDKHRTIFIEAQKSYREAVIKELDSMLADARSGKQIRRSLTLVEPMDQTKDYDRAIKMLEMSVDNEIELAETDFRSYVLDEWHWKGQFNLSNSRYSKTLTDEIEAAGQ